MSTGEFNPNIISKLRSKHGLTQEQLAQLLGVAFSTVNTWETGKRLPQKRMQDLLKNLVEKNKLPQSPENHNISGSEGNSGLLRSDAGFVSSLINYDGNRDPAEFTHSIGRWYGSLPSFLVRDLVKFLATDFSFEHPALVNFSGSGTVPIEFGLAGHKCFSVDLNPVAVLLTHIKTQIDQPPLAKDLGVLLEDLSKFLSDNEALDDHTSGISPKNLIVHENRWIDASIQNKFMQIISWINNIKDPQIQIIATVSLINIAVDFCNIDKRCTNHYVYKENKLLGFEIIDRFQKEAYSIVQACQSLLNVTNFVRPVVNLADSINLPHENDFFSTVFSHPPYGNIINYFSISRVHLSILELIELKASLWPDSIRKNLLSWVQEKDLSSGTVNKFNELVVNWISEANRVLKQGGNLLVIIGDTRVKGFLYHPHTLIISEAEKTGMRVKEIFIWVTNHKSGMHVRRKGNHIDHNYIIIFEKL